MTPLTPEGAWALFAFGLRSGLVVLGLVLPTAVVALTFRYRWEIFCCALAVAHRVAGLFRLSPERELDRRIRREVRRLRGGLSDLP